MKKQLWENGLVVNEDHLTPMVYTVGWPHFLISRIDVEHVNTDELTKGFKTFQEFEGFWCKKC